MEEAYLKDVSKLFEYYRILGEKAMDQVEENDLFWKFDPHSNSIAVIVKHLAGNMLSRWTDFLNSDGEKTWRDRDSEFEADLTTKKQVIETWNTGWDSLFSALNKLKGSDMTKTIYIRNTGHSVSEAINRQLAHYAAHVGQIVLLAKMIKKEAWQSLSIPKGGSNDFNKSMFSRDLKNNHFTDDLT